MHGADRIGGLSSANGLVFGHIAGTSAAAWAAGAGAGHDAASAEDVERDVPLPCQASPEAAGVLRELRRLMQEHCMVVRTEEGLRACLDGLHGLEGRLGAMVEPCGDPDAVAATCRAQSALLTSRALASAMLARTESRGAHYRADHACEDPAQQCMTVLAERDVL